MVTHLHEPETEGPLAKVRRLEQIIVTESTPSNLTSSRKTPTAQSHSKHQCTFDINPTNLPNISLTQIQQTTCNNSQPLQPTSNLNRTCQSSSDLSPNQQSSSNHTPFYQTSSNLDRASLPESNLNRNYQTTINPTPKQANNNHSNLNPTNQSTVTRNPVDKSTSPLIQQPPSNLNVSNQSISINPS